MIAHRSNCSLYGYLFSVVARFGDNDELLAVEPDASRYHYDDRITERYRYFVSKMELLNNKERGNYPQKAFRRARLRIMELPYFALQNKQS